MKAIGKNYIYSPETTELENGVNVVSKWIMELQDTYLASWFATPSTQEDQSLKLQLGYDYAVSKKRPFEINGKFYVKANQQRLGTNGNAILLRSNSILKFSPEGSLNLITENVSGYNLLLARQIDNYEVHNPRLVGDRLISKYPFNETTKDHAWGYGLTIYESSNGYIFKPECSQMWGDGIYVGKAWGTNSIDVPKNITIIEPKISHVRRNGISLTSWDNVRIVRPEISDVGDSDGITGAFPKACIDVEPEGAEGYPKPYGINGIIESPILKNSDNGIFIYAFHDNQEFNLHISGQTTLENIKTIGAGFFHGANNAKGKVRVDNLTFKDALTYTSIVSAWHKASELTCEIDHVYPAKNSENFVMSTIKNGLFSSNELGNYSINNLHTTGYTSFMADIGAHITIDGYKLNLSKDAKRGISIYSSNIANQCYLRGKDTFINSGKEYIHRGWSVSTRQMPNIIWQDPSIDTVGTTPIYIDTTDDYRHLKIGLSNDTYIVGTGCNIMGLNIRHTDGITYSRARTLTRGGWIEFRKNTTGYTEIINQYGDWTFNTPI